MTDRDAVRIRTATAADAADLARLLTEEGYPTGSADMVARLDRFSSDYSQVRVAESGGQVLGLVALHVLPRFEHDDRVVRVLALVVGPDVRERGLGSRLMEEAERVGRDVGAAFIEVTAGHHRPDARRLYESLHYDAGATTYLRKRL
jgi:predicted N-acetyltransferase YhbS